jgi:DNA-binding NarL/FixJ family response regulator
MGGAPSADNPVRVAIVDDHVLLRQSLASLLQSHPEVEVVAEFDNGRDAVAGMKEADPHVVLMDVALPRLNGIEACRQLHRDLPHIRTIMLSAHVDADHLRAALRAGAVGYVVKRADIAELFLAIQTVRLGNTFFSSDISRDYDIPALMLEARQENGHASGLDALTGREREIFQLLVEGNSVSAIARELVLSPKTVEGHKTRLMAKLGVHNRVELIRFSLSSERRALDGVSWND